MVKNPPMNAGDIRDAGSIPGSSPGGGMATHSSIFARQATVHEVTKSWTQLKQLSTHICIYISHTSLEGLMRKLKAPILWLPDAKSQLIRKKTLMLGKTEGRRRRR